MSVSMFVETKFNIMKNIITPLILLLLIGTISSCSEETPPQNNTSASSPTPSFSNMDGLFAAIQVVSYQDIPFVGEIAVYTDVATAAVLETQNATSYLEAGDVSVNTHSLSPVDNNAYVLPSPSAPTDLDFDFSTSSQNEWVIGGSTNVTAFNHTTTDQTPGDIKFSMDYSNVNTANNLVLEVENYPINTDSILFVVAFENTTLTKTVGSPNKSATFTSAELSGASGSGVVQAAAYNFELVTISSKNYYFINESVVSQIAEF